MALRDPVLRKEDTILARRRSARPRIAEFDRVRTQGIAVNDGELAFGLRSILAVDQEAHRILA
jgi:DNA-binding IclR family transcriptional regulator